MKLEYLPKLLLQQDDSPYDLVDLDFKSLLIKAADAQRLVCCMHPNGCDVAVGLGQRLVLLRTSQSQPLHFTTPTTAPEYITSLVWLSFSSSLDDSCILVGTSEGFIQLHSSDGVLLHRQDLHESAVVALHARRAGSSIDPEDSVQDVTVTFSNAVARLTILDIAAAARWHQKSRQGGGWWGAGAPHLLSPMKWELHKTTGNRSFAAIAGPAPTSLYSEVSRRKELSHRLLLFTTGADPPVSVFHVEESSTGGLFSYVGGVASASASQILGRAKGFLPGRSLDRGGAGGAEVGKPREKIIGVAVTQERAVWDDDKRVVNTVSISPCSRWAACCDTLGRVSLVDVASCMLLRILKGYRNAQAAWLVPAPIAQHSQSRREALLVVFAPRRGAVELWRAHAGVRVGTLSIKTEHGVLIQQPAVVVAPGSAAAATAVAVHSWKQHMENACWLLDLETLELMDLTSKLNDLWGKYCSAK